jgi:hypothetical protein
MKILFLDFCYFRGHKKLNIQLLEILDRHYEVEVIAKKKYYSEEVKKSLSNTIFKEFEVYEEPLNSPLFARIRIFHTMLKNFFMIRNINYDKIVIAGFENITLFLLGSLFFTRTETFIIHHQNTDELNNSVKLNLFKKNMNKIKHIVLEEFIRNFLTSEVGVKKSNAFYISHPLSNYDTTLEKIKSNSNKKLLVGLSNSNDEELIKELISSEKYKNMLRDKEINIVLKSKKYEFKSENIRVFNKFLERDEYDNYIRNADYFLMLFPATFKYRMSGTLIDSLSNGTKVIGTSIPCIKAFSERYPSICKAASSFDEILTIASETEITDKVSSEFKQFKQEHSFNSILNQFKEILGE